MKDALIIGVAALAVFAVWKATQPAAAAVAAPPPQPSAWEQSVLGAEAGIQRATGVPVAAVGDAASKAPTWLKLAVFPVGVTAVTQSLVTHPTATLKSAYHTVGNAASSVGNAIKGLF